MEIVGPVSAQKKLDAMATKSFVPLDPTEPPRSHRTRSRSVTSRKKGAGPAVREETLLCPLEDFPTTPPVTGGHFSHLPDSGGLATPIKDTEKLERPPTP